METVADLQRKLDAAKKAEEADRLAQRTAQYKEAVRIAITARNARDEAAANMKHFQARRDAQLELIHRCEDELGRLVSILNPESAIVAVIQSDLPRPPSEDQLAKLETKRAQLVRRIERERQKLGELNAGYGSWFAAWLDRQKEFQLRDWQCAQLRPVSTEELHQRSHTVSDGMGVLSRVS